jgi:hypothetical protein
LWHFTQPLSSGVLSCFAAFQESYILRPSTQLTVGLLQTLPLFNVLDMRLSDHQQNHWWYVTRLLIALSEFYLQQTVEAVRKSPFFGLIIDLSSDRSSSESMLVYVVYFDMNTITPSIAYLCCVRLLGIDGQTVHKALIDICDVCGFDMDFKLRTFCADGDGSMQGHRKAVVGRLRGHCDCLLACYALRST